ncbi:hypothetical protein HII31_10343 [Pseudocercospora fuligena]|uniref:Uncharacterized protein n=1 Tax=Pseudocercospora fuligena TaxID=685502 RepID=A0A8H6VHH3_9PEZI|nr:hypothetical protein HII31_10343 [Pseudocercospora fuligena]
MTDHEYDFDLEGFRTARINSAHHLGDYVVERWDDDWEDRFWAGMEEIKAKEILKFQERLAKEVFHQPANESSLMVAQSSDVPGEVGEQRSEEGHGGTFTNGGSKYHQETLKNVGDTLGEEGVPADQYFDNNPEGHAGTVGDDGEMENVRESLSSSRLGE